MHLKEKLIGKIKNDFPAKKILIIGDLMVDEYVMGKVDRISAEAPVAVLNYQERKLEAGGAGNVAYNVRCLGGEAGVLGTAADDETGRWLRAYFSESKIDCGGIFEEEGRPTTVKTRFQTKGYQLLRMDTEVSHAISGKMKAEIFAYLESVLPNYDAVVLSDYQKGVLNDGIFVRRIIGLCNEHKVFVSVDSKRRDIEALEGADFVKPNNLELEKAVGVRIDDDSTLTSAGNLYLEKSKAKALIVTRGGAGISIFLPNGIRQDYASKAVLVFNVTGAGDTVISTITLGMISGLTIDEAVQCANLAAGVVISKVGTAAITGEELIRRIREE